MPLISNDFNIVSKFLTTVYATLQSRVNFRQISATYLGS